LEKFSRPRTVGLRALELAETDELVGVGLTDGDSNILLFSSSGKAIRFAESDVREMGRTARGVRGIALKKGQSVISMIIVANDIKDYQVLVATKHGYGKRTELAGFPTKRRGGQGVIAIKVEGRNGTLVGAELVSDYDQLMLITDGGRLVRTRITEISTLGRNTQGVRLISLRDGENLVSIGGVDEANGADNGDTGGQVN
jgi:DNA gyrase subunit A